MKFILSLSFLLITLCSKAECGFRGIDIWPDGPTLGPSPTLMIEGYGLSESTILDLNKKHRIYLVSESDTVNLIVKELLVGQFDLTQAILTTERALISGAIYQLRIDSLPEYDRSYLKWHNRKPMPAQWVILDAVQESQLAWLSKPHIIDKTNVLYGCGPSKWVKFHFDKNDTLASLIKATLKNTDTGQEVSYYVIVEENSNFMIGHGMCSGGFLFNDHAEYEIYFEILNEH